MNETVPPINRIIQARRADIGAYEVARVLPYRELRMVGPFTFLDHAGPVTIPPSPGARLDVLPHPHIGLSTVSYLLSGEMMHRDSTGAEQTLRPGDVNWMIAGKGVSHSERIEGDMQTKGGTLELLQAWVALPVEAEESEPAFFHHANPELPTFAEDGAWSRLIAGSAFGVDAPVKAHSPLFYLHAELRTGAKTTLPQDYPERAAYVVKGRIEVAGQSYAPGQLLVFAPEASPILTALEPSTVMLLGGEPVGPRHIWWNFVASSKERIEQAKADWQSGRLALPPRDDQAFIPLPS
jgi:redox-sensitive bicupin YhaK (pirin superfamily)